jgi:hypothetical protein
MMERAVTLFPQPDSPTSPRVSPLFRQKETPSLLAIPSRVKKSLGLYT